MHAHPQRPHQPHTHPQPHTHAHMRRIHPRCTSVSAADTHLCHHPRPRLHRTHATFAALVVLAVVTLLLLLLSSLDARSHLGTHAQSVPSVANGPYAVLGVAPSASATQIRKAYLQLSKRLHPDKNPDPAAHEQFQLVQHAYELLSDADKRSAFDRTRQVPADSLFASSFPSTRSQQQQQQQQQRDPFAEMFGGGGGFGGFGGSPYGTFSSASAALRTAMHNYQTNQAPFAPSALYFKLTTTNYATFVTNHVPAQPHHAEFWVIYLYAEACSACTTARARFDQLCKFIHDDIQLANVVRLGTIHAQFESSLAERLGITHVPAFVIVTASAQHGSRETVRLSGHVPYTEVLTHLTTAFLKSSSASSSLSFSSSSSSSPLFVAHIQSSYETMSVVALLASHLDRTRGPPAHSAASTTTYASVPWLSYTSASASAVAAMPVFERFRHYLAAQRDTSSRTQVYILSSSPNPTLLVAYLAARLGSMHFVYVAVPFLLAPSLHNQQQNRQRGGGGASPSSSPSSAHAPSLSELLAWLRMSREDADRIASLLSSSECVFVVHQLHSDQPASIIETVGGAVMDAPTMLRRLRKFEYPIVPRLVLDNYFDLCVRSSQPSYTFAAATRRHDAHSSPSGHKTCLVLFVDSAARAHEWTRSLVQSMVANAPHTPTWTYHGSATDAGSSSSSHGDGGGAVAKHVAALMDANVQVVWAHPAEHAKFFTFFTRAYDRVLTSKRGGGSGSAHLPLLAVLYTPRTSEFTGFVGTMVDAPRLLRWTVDALDSRQQRLTGLAPPNAVPWGNAQHYGGPPPLVPAEKRGWFHMLLRWLEPLAVYLPSMSLTSLASSRLLEQLAMSIVVILFIFTLMMMLLNMS